MKRILGLDVGDRRIGVAVSDELRITARGLLTIERTSIKSDTNILLDIIQKNNCSHAIIGLPVKLSGEDSIQTQKVRDFAKKLSDKLTSNSMGDIEVILYDERFTTVIANRVMDESGASSNKKRQFIDQQAAAIIIEDWIRSNEKV